MGIKIDKTFEVIKVCPNQEKHIRELVDKVKANPVAAFVHHLPHLSPVFCEQCGAKLIDKTIEYENPICERCGGTVYLKDSYCPYCGDIIR